MRIESLEDIPDRATITSEFTRCGNPSCNKKHGPYMYAYWKEQGKLKKAYIGKSKEHLRRRLLYQKAHRETGMSVPDARKMIILAQYALEGNPLAIEYRDKIRLKKCSPAWAYRKLSEHLRDISGTKGWRPSVRIRK